MSLWGKEVKAIQERFTSFFLAMDHMFSLPGS